MDPTRSASRTARGAAAGAAGAAAGAARRAATGAARPSAGAARWAAVPARVPPAALDRDAQRRIAQAGKEIDPAWYRVHRGVSIHLTRIALAAGARANHASLGMMACGLVGALLLVPSTPVAWIAGFVVLYLSFLLDKVDGELARLQGTQNLQGIFLDRLHHRLVEPCLFLAVAVHEMRLGGGLLPLVLGFVTVLLANAIEENQHLAPYLLYKRVREGAPLPGAPGGPPAPPRSRAWARAAALFRPLKGFRMFIVALPLFALSYVLEWSTGRPVPTWSLAACCAGLAAYLVFQCIHYLREQLDAEAHAIARVLRTGMDDALPGRDPRIREARRPLAEGDDAMKNSSDHFGPKTTPRVPFLPAVLAFALGLGLAVAGLAAGPGTAAAAGTFYVDGANPSCSNSGPGSAAVPYCTISAAVTAQAGPGTTIRVAPGLYREQVTVPASGSGTAGNPFILLGVGSPSNPVVIDGSEDFGSPGQWTPATGTTWLAAGVTWATLMVIVDGEHLVPWGGAPDSVPVGGFRYVAGSGLYVNLGVAGNPGNPGLFETRVGRIMHGVFVNGRAWVTIRGLRIQNTNDRGIQVTNSSDIVVEDNVVESVQRFGIQAQGSTRVRIARNRTTGNGDHGITLTAGTTASVVEDNESDHNARPGVRAANGIHLFGAPDNVLRFNRVHHNQDTGIHVQAGSDSTVSVRNLAWANGDHGFDHLMVIGSIHVGDVAHGNFMDGFSFEGNTQGQRMFNCISTANGLTTGRYDLYVDSTSAIGHVSNDNVFWNPTSQAPVKYDQEVYLTVAAYSAATGQDSRSIQADPRFAAPQIGDFHLIVGSPAIDAANTGIAGWPSTDADGFAPVDDPGTANTGLGPIPFADRGAFEYGTGGLVGVPGEDPPAAVGFEGVTPNPLPGGTAGRLLFRTSRPGVFAVDLYDARGRHVRRVVAAEMAPAGLQVAPLDGRGADGRLLPAGLYLYRVRTVDGERGGKFVLVR